MARVIGLTGGIGTGKSTVAGILEELGAVLVDADAIVHELQSKGSPLLDEIIAEFGSDYRTAEGELDRKRLGEHIFSNPKARARLGAITGPPIVRELARQIEAARNSPALLAFVDVPLLYESARRAEGSGIPTTADAVEGTVVVWAPERLQVERQMKRDGATREHALERLKSQLPIDEKRELADWLIDNSGALEDTRRQVEALFQELSTRPAVSPSG